MKRKGISPLIAAVLLIAFTMAVASIFAQWAPQLMEDAQGDTTDRANEIQDCSDRTLDVSSNDGGDTVVIQQTGGTEGIGNLTATFYYESGSAQQNQTNDYGNWIKENESRGIATLGNPGSSDVTEVQIQPTDCQGAPAASWEAE
ncbi:MAG: flagellin-like protein [Candidatus Nanohaloarchaea archaeon]|jgi:flagellin-like protein